MTQRWGAWDMDTTESIDALTGTGSLPADNNTAPTAPVTLRRVMWARGVSYSAQLHGDYGTTLHLTISEGFKGKTLCGRQFPYDKGHPAAHRTCRVCLKKARAEWPALNLQALDFVP